MLLLFRICFFIYLRQIYNDNMQMPKSIKRVGKI